MLNRSASLAMSTSVLEALPGKHDIKIHSPSILYVPINIFFPVVEFAFHHGHLRGKREHHPLAYQLFLLFTKYMYNVQVFIFCAICRLWSWNVALSGYHKKKLVACLYLPINKCMNISITTLTLWFSLSASVSLALPIFRSVFYRVLALFFFIWSILDSFLIVKPCLEILPQQISPTI